MIVTFRLRRDTAANWASANPVLALGEPGLETDTRRVKYGNGTTGWNALPYASASVAWGAITGNLADQVDLSVALASKVPTTRTIATTAPLTGGGDLSANRTLAISPATQSAPGSLSAVDKIKLDNTSGVNSGDNANTTGNAGTATKWQTARTLTLSGDATGSASIDGSANVTVAVTLGTVSVAKGGTGATTASAARDNLGLTIGTNVQAQDAELQAIANLVSAADRLAYFTGAGSASLAVLTAFARSILAAADAASARSVIGAGTGNGSVTSVSVATANGVSGTVANASTTPAITLTLGAITPSSVVSSGDISAGTSSQGRIVNRPDGVNTGYTEFRLPSGARAGYMGFAAGAGGSLQLVAENGFPWQVVGGLRTDTLRIDQAPTSGTFTPTAYVTVNLNGANYRIPVAPV